MGTYYWYVNHTKRERFPISAAGGGIKQWNLGFTLAARAFELMLCPDFSGRWASDSIAILSDENTADWDHIETYTDVSANAILQIFEVDGLECLGPAARQYDSLYVQLCFLTVSSHQPRLGAKMEEFFGPDYLKRYKELCSKPGNDFSPLNLVP